MKKLQAILAGIAAFAMSFAAIAATETVDGVTWTYRTSGSTAELFNNNACCIPSETSGEITVPSQLGGYTVTKIGVRAFQWCSELTKITIPSTVTEIGDYAFADCTGLVELVIPDSVTTCGSGLFERSYNNDKSLSLKRLTIPLAHTAIDQFGDNNTPIPDDLVVITKTTYAGVTFTVKCNAAGRSYRYAQIGTGGNPAIDPVAVSGNVTVPAAVNAFGKSFMVRVIGDYAFLGCDKVTNAILPDSVDIIATAAFQNCTALQSIETPGVQFIDERAFYQCTALEEVNLPAKFGEMANSAFYGCTSLTKVKFNQAESEAWIGEQAFYGCSRLSNITLPEGVSTIGEQAFANCTRLASVTLPDTVREIGTKAFQGCTTLRHARFPKRLYTYSGDWWALPVANLNDIFTGCTHTLLEVVFMENGTSAGISYLLLQDCFWYYDVIGSGINRFVSLKYGGPDNDCAVYPAPAGALTIPYSLAGFPVKYVNGFQNCTGLTAVDIPHSVETIWSNAFRGCSNLGKVTIGDGIDEWTDINNNAFANCPNLSLVTVPDALYPIDNSNLERVFAGHSSLFTANGSFCYRNSSGNYCRQWGDDGNLWKFEIIDSANVAILGASGLSKKTVPLTLAGIPVTSIADNAFKGDSIKEFVIPAYSSVATIGASAFANSQITNFVVNSASVTSLGQDVFSGCTALEAVTLPVAELPKNAFYGCTSLADVECTPGTIGEFAFCNCPEVDVGYVIASASTIGRYAFASSNPVTKSGELYIPDTVTSIGERAFSKTCFSGGASLPGALAGQIDEASVFYGWTPSMPITYRLAGGGYVETVNGVTWRYTVDINNNATIVGATLPDSGLYTGAFPSTLGGRTVVAIAQSAFENDTRLRNITIPASVTTIGASAFQGAASGSGTSNLRSITFKEGLTTIAANAFAYSRLGVEMAQLYIPDSVTSIGAGAFSHCTYLTHVSLPGRFYRTLDVSSVFADCHPKIRITYRLEAGDVMSQTIDGCTWYILKDGSTVKLYGAVAGTQVYNAASPAPTGALVLPMTVCGYTVNTIGAYAFKDCTGITSVTIPENITKIEARAFDGCTGLTSIDIPSSVTDIADYAFANCSNLAKASLPDALNNGHSGLVFNGANPQIVYYSKGGISSVNISGYTWYYRVEDGKAELFYSDDYTASHQAVSPKPTGHVIIPNTLGGYPVTKIGKYAFYGYDSYDQMTSVTIPASVTEIGYGAFWSCDSLESVMFTQGSSLSTIGQNAFRQCHKLESLDLLAEVTTIGEQAFEECTSLTALALSDSVNKIGASAFNGCTGLESVSLPDTLTDIGSAVFRNCSSLTNVTLKTDAAVDSFMDIFDRTYVKNVTIAEGVTTIGRAAFCYDVNNKDNYVALESVSLPETLETIGDYAFRWAQLKNVTIPVGVKSIGAYAFADCEQLESVNIPAHLTGDSVGEYAFYDCTSLADITFDPSATSVGAYNMFAGCTGLASVTIPYGVTAIAECTFNGCTSLATLRIPRTVESIGENAFNSAGLATVYVAARDTARVKALFVASGLDSAFVDTITFIEDAPEYWNITFVDEDDGSVIDIYEREPNTALGELPDPTKPYSDFLGWYTAGNVEVTSETLATADVTYYAHFEPVRYVVSISDPLNPSGGLYWTMAHGDPLSDDAYFATPPVHPGYVFLGWFTEDGEEIDLDAPLTAGIVIYLKWAKELEIGLVKVVDGVAEATEYDTTNALSGVVMTLPDAPAAPEGKSFVGWSASLGGALMPAGADFFPDDDTDTLYANFEEIVWDGDLSTLTGDATAQDGTVIHGTLVGNYKVTIADGATVTLSNATINVSGVGSNEDLKWAGITCLGDAEIILSPGTVNVVKGFFYEYPGIYVPVGSTLTIGGSGSLTASSNGFGAGIGAGYGQTASGVPIPCGNIRIEGGTITAIGGGRCAGIGGGNHGSTCGDIEILGGTITATGGDYGAGIGGGDVGSCGDITIGAGVTRVVATAGAGYGTQPIGGGDDAESCGDVTVDPSLTDDNGSPTRTITGGSAAPAAYSSWATANGVTGAWDATDASGIANVFRYAFNQPTGDFTLLGIEFNEDGKAVIITPALVNAEGFDITVIASDNVDGTGNIGAIPLNASGRTVINEEKGEARFFRLDANATE